MRNRLNIALLDYVLSRAAVFAANAMSVSEYVERSVAKSKHLRGSALCTIVSLREVSDVKSKFHFVAQIILLFLLNK